jgi:hypothetical protein
MKNKLITTAFLLYSFFGFSQFDLVLEDPLNNHPSFAGNSGKKRISASYAFEKRRNSQIINYDFFSRKLKGAWGIRTANHRFYFNNEASFKIVYSPKLTSLKKKTTWAPAIGIEYSNFYKNRYNELKTVFWLVTPEKFNPYKTNSIDLSLSLNINSSKNLFVSTVNIDPVFKVFRSEVMLAHKFDYKPNNNWSSTITIANRIIINDKQNSFVEGLHYKYIIHYNNFPDTTLNGALISSYHNYQNRLIGTYAVKFKNLGLLLNADFLISDKKRPSNVINPYGTNILIPPIEKYNQYVMNNVNALISYKSKQLTLYTKLSFGYLKTIKYKDPENETLKANNFAPFPDYTVYINYKKITLGANYVF